MAAFKRQFLNQREHVTMCCCTGHTIDMSMASRGFGVTPSHVMAVPESQPSQHYGERAITQVDYEGTQTVRSENFMHPQNPSVSHSHSRSRRRRDSHHGSKAPDIMVQRKWCIGYLLVFCFHFNSAVNHECG